MNSAMPPSLGGGAGPAESPRAEGPRPDGNHEDADGRTRAARSGRVLGRPCGADQLAGLGVERLPALVVVQIAGDLTGQLPIGSSARRRLGELRDAPGHVVAERPCLDLDRGPGLAVLLVGADVQPAMHHHRLTLSDRLEGVLGQRPPAGHGVVDGVAVAPGTELLVVAALGRREPEARHPHAARSDSHPRLAGDVARHGHQCLVHIILLIVGGVLAAAVEAAAGASTEGGPPAELWTPTIREQLWTAGGLLVAPGRSYEVGLA